ncbi:MAG TPA: S8 family serine peptidase [Miltoncostaeaceae bacterium]|nr:S8 family serine peptidase [Miltoncostaeaceae bacterium]
MSDLRRALRGLGAAAAGGALLALAGTAAAAPPAPPKDDPALAPAKAPRPATGLGRVAPGADALLVTFTDRPAAPEAARRLAGLGTTSPLVPEAGVWRLAPGTRGDVRAAAARRAGVASAEWPLARTVAQRPRPAAPLPSIAPPPLTDPLRGGQWMLASNGWEPSLTGRTPRPVIAVLDSGIDRQHEEWGGKGSPLLPGHTVFPRRASDADDWDVSGHGTHVAGIAAAPANGVGVVGVAPARADGAAVLPVQVADQFGDFEDEAIIRGIRHAVRRGARVINISAGGEGYLNALQETVYWATQRGAVIVAAVGNEGDGTLLYPAAYQRVIGVGAQCGPRRDLDCPTPFGVARFSTRNRSVDVVAPGVEILSTVPVGVERNEVQPGYALKSGTSMAAPYVAGVVALVQAANGNDLSPDQVRAHLGATARDLGRRGRDDVAGHGAVDVPRAVTTPAPPDDVAEVNDDIRFVRGSGTNLATRRRLAVTADIDRRDDQDDVYAVRVRAGQRLRVELVARTGRLNLYLWGPRTRTVATGEANLRRNLLAFAGGPRLRQVAVIRARTTGRYFINVYARSGATPYTLRAWTLP